LKGNENKELKHKAFCQSNILWGWPLNLARECSAGLKRWRSRAPLTGNER